MGSFAAIKWRIVLVGMGAFILGGLAVGLFFMKRTEETRITGTADHSHGFAKYSCAMHPSITSDHPAKCPICGMDLQKIDDGEPPTDAVPSKKPLFYRHPMRGEITSPVPAKDEMGMDYIPVYEDESKEAVASAVDGRAAFSLSTERQQLIGVTTAKVEKRPLGLEIRASGKVAYDPELFTAVEEYRQAVLSSFQMKNSSYGSLKEQSDELVSAAQTKLKLLGLTDSQIQKLAQGNKAAATDLILPKGNAWVYAEVFEYEIANVKIGQTMEVVAPALPRNIFSGKITGISPILNPQTRTVRVRAAVPDPQGVLRPDTFVNARIKIDLGMKLAVPNDSILHSGEQNFVFVMKEKGRFEPKSVSLGTNAGELTEIVAGIEEGETVVTSANFLIDSESRLRAAIRNAEPAPTKSKRPGAKP